MLRFLAVAAVAIGLSVPAFAADVQLCKMRVSQGNQGDMIAKEIYLINDGGRMLVLDDIVNFFNKGQPQELRLAEEKANSRTYAWDVLMVNAAGQRTKMQDRATLFLDSSELHVLARPVGYNNSISATGRCAPYTG